MKSFIAITLVMLAVTAFAGRPVGKRELVKVNFGIGANNDVIPGTALSSTLFNVEAKTVINDVILFTETACVGGNIIVGDGDDDNGFVLTAAEDVAGASLLKGTLDTYRGAYIGSTASSSLTKYYAAADTIDITYSATPFTACEQTYYFDITRLD